MNDRTVAVMLVCLGAAPAVRAAETEVKIDLGRQAPGSTETVLVAAGVEVTFRLVNRIPTMNYDVAVRREPIPILCTTEPLRATPRSRRRFRARPRRCRGSR